MDEAVLDTPVEEVELEEGAEPLGEGGESDGGEHAETPAEVVGAKAAEPLIVEGKLSVGVQKVLDRIKAEDPEGGARLARQIRAALFQSQSFAASVPGGMREIKELRDTIENLGGKEGIERVQSELSSWQEFDQKFTAGDPDVIKLMTDTPDGQKAFAQLMPAAFAKFAELHSEGYNHYITGVITRDMDGQGVPMAMQLLQYHLSKGDSVAALEESKKIVGWYQRIKGISDQAPAAPQIKGAEGNGDAAKEFETREANLLRKEFMSESRSGREQSYQSEWAKLKGQRQISEGQKEAIEALYERKMGAAIEPYRGKLDRFLATKDKTGYLRLCQQINTTELPKALKYAFEHALPARSGIRAPGTGTPAVPANGRPAPAGTATQGFRMVDKFPGTENIDMRISTHSMILSGKAVLKDGKKVQWKK